MWLADGAFHVRREAARIYGQNNNHSQWMETQKRGCMVYADLLTVGRHLVEPELPEIRA
jgi:hypothetical protein